ncbi:heparinase II/III family protein [Sphingomicrobium astaxanthinifaciens]|uniref:heparinase II/III family protein n=1 Tax=Sphingomicrobium astaxanthinifaciens TaxID=1227949 RepID=UPI001FCAE4F2|nr:heparinase II/III family protein [Sphingomicrobium astaxanthinifaciens]MCJ7421224.1 heparinase II/III family protein [Sphingomicrobium astaxanthinifaciens]
MGEGGWLGRLLGGRRQSLRLAAVARDHVEGDRSIGEALVAGTLVHDGERFGLKGLDVAALDLARPIHRHLHGFSWLRDLAAATGREQGARLGEAVTRRWLATHGDEPDAAWAPDLMGERLLFWMAYAPYVLSSRDEDYRRALLNVMARAARLLGEQADKVPPGLPRITAWSGMTAACLCMEGDLPRVARAEGGLMRALGQGQHEDGGLISRRPWEQALLVDRLGLVRAAYAAAKQALPDALEDAAGAALAALHGVRMGDGGLASWQGGNPGEPQRLDALVEGCGMRARPLRKPRGWGYHRLSALGTVVQIDAAPPPLPPHAPAAHASCLAIEIADGSQRLVMGCGGPAARPDRLPPALVAGLRGSDAHSGLILGGANSTPLGEDGVPRKGLPEVEIERKEDDHFSRLTARHDGYVKRFGLLHERKLALANDGKEVRGEDNLLPEGRRLRRRTLPFLLRFHIAPDVEVIATADAQGALLRPRNAPPWQFRCTGGSLSLEQSLVIGPGARPINTSQLVITAEAGKEGATVNWQFRRSS